MAVCKNCNGHYRPHHMCLNCGFYNGRVVIDLAAKKQDRVDRIKAKKDMIAAQGAESAPAATEAK